MVGSAGNMVSTAMACVAMSAAAMATNSRKPMALEAAPENSDCIAQPFFRRQPRNWPSYPKGGVDLGDRAVAGEAGGGGEPRIATRCRRGLRTLKADQWATGGGGA